MSRVMPSPSRAWGEEGPSATDVTMPDTNRRSSFVSEFGDGDDGVAPFAQRKDCRRRLSTYARAVHGIESVRAGVRNSITGHTGRLSVTGKRTSLQRSDDLKDALRGGGEGRVKLTIADVVHTAGKQKFDKRVLEVNVYLVVIALIGIALMVVGLQLPSGAPLHVVECLNAASTLLLLHQLFRLYQLKYRLLNSAIRMHEKAPRGSQRVSLACGAVVETAVLGFCPYPYCNIREPGLLMFLRLYLALRVLRDRNPLYINRHMLGKQEVALSNIDSALILRLALHSRPLVSILTFCALLLTIVAYSMTVIETAASGGEFNMGDAWWLIAETATTVGFGDIIPITIAGKFLTVLTAMVGILLSALVIASIHSQLSLSSQQAYAVKAMQIERLREKERALAAKYIAGTWRWLVEHRAINQQEEEEQRASQRRGSGSPKSKASQRRSSCASTREAVSAAARCMRRSSTMRRSSLGSERCSCFSAASVQLSGVGGAAAQDGDSPESSPSRTQSPSPDPLDPVAAAAMAAAQHEATAAKSPNCRWPTPLKRTTTPYAGPNPRKLTSFRPSMAVSEVRRRQHAARERLTAIHQDMVATRKRRKAIEAAAVEPTMQLLYAISGSARSLKSVAHENAHLLGRTAHSQARVGAKLKEGQQQLISHVDGLETRVGRLESLVEQLVAHARTGEPLSLAAIEAPAGQSSPGSGRTLADTSALISQAGARAEGGGRRGSQQQRLPPDRLADGAQRGQGGRMSHRDLNDSGAHGLEGLGARRMDTASVCDADPADTIPQVDLT